ncbi:DUF6243 family protein [Actinomadura sp. 9N407]|uniref:DUF6243 family protein n=1 Tax=Actinomadura sp. 9N407 TaxID=3375154 RepID=UPI003787B25C
MAKSRNGMLGVGGQRKKISRKALRGQAGGAAPSSDGAATKKELLRKMRERNATRDSEA